MARSEDVHVASRRFTSRVQDNNHTVTRDSIPCSIHDCGSPFLVWLRESPRTGLGGVGGAWVHGARWCCQRFGYGSVRLR
jgi:hypothetical protein